MKAHDQLAARARRYAFPLSVLETLSRTRLDWLLRAAVQLGHPQAVDAVARNPHLPEDVRQRLQARDRLPARRVESSFP